MENKILINSIYTESEVRRPVYLTSNFYIQIILLFLFTGGINLSPQAQTLDNYLIQAAENNPGLKSSYLEFEAAMQKTAQVKALPDLSLSFGYFVSPVETRVGPQRAKFSLVQMFPWFGTNGLAAEVSEYNAQAKYQEFLDQKNRLYLQVKLAYYPIYELHQKIKWQKENLDILKTYKRLATTNFSNGKGAMVDVIRVDIMIDELETEVQLLKDQLEPLRVTFNRLLNRPDSLDVNVLDQLSIEIKNDFDRDSISTNPALDAVELNIQGARASEIQANKQGLPTFGVGIDYVIVDKRSGIDLPDNGKNVFMPMVTMSLPLFRGKYQASVKQAQLTQQALEHKKEALEDNLAASYEQAIYKLESAKRRYELFNNQITKTQQAIELLNTSYANNGEDFEEILRMEQQLLKYRIAQAKEVKNFYLAEAQLNYITANQTR